uniref:Uncharacterized protein n=1 Tax=Anopheles albimanus TaxID=7167 RepID=A0A182FN96_ANOAL
MGNSPNPKQYTKYSKNTAEVRVKKCIPIQRGMFRLGRGNLFYLILIKIFTILNNIVNKCLYQCTDTCDSCDKLLQG